MPDRYTYLLVDTFCILFPFLFSFHPRINFYRQWRFFILPCLFTALFFLVWDGLFTHAGIWSFNSRYVIGAWLFGMPLEEYLFFFCIPYACVFTYYSLDRFFKFAFMARIWMPLSVVLIVFLAVTGIFHLSQLYTSVTFLLLAVLLTMLVVQRAVFMTAFYISFLLILVPFFISNGILTGSITPEPVVWYNKAHNLGIRMGTIPFEDTFYGMILLLMNVSGFEYLRKRSVQ